MSRRYPRRRFLELGVAAAAAAAASAEALVACAPPRVAQIPHVEKLSGKVQHFVVLMMENRSHDQMLGAIAAGPPPGTVLRHRGGEVPLRFGIPRDQFYPDPPHRLAKVQQQIYGVADSSGSGHGHGHGLVATMGGFGQVFMDEKPIVPEVAATLEDYATCYADGSLPILQTLAKEYGVCTRWFSAFPGSTTPNRMFTHAGTSGGATSQGAYYSRIRGEMIFDALGDRRDLWRVYYHDIPHLWLTGDAWVKAFSAQQRRIGHFARDVRNDELPVYTFIEPRHVIPPWNSQHPFMGVSHGEQLIARVYNELIANPRVFEKTLLLIVYDEHGGFYDHVVPPGHPGSELADHRVIVPSGPSAEGFEFDRLGPRVPAVLVSPWIERGTRFEAIYDHTSILSTVASMTGCAVRSPRARAAFTLESTLSRATPRRDASRLTYRSGDYLNSHHAIPTDIGGVAGEIQEHWQSLYGEPELPERMAAHYESLLTSG
ncbi:MAG: alkaline phosphatase family protein [Labilithrix sp.]